METCLICGLPIKVQIFKHGRGYCSDDCRKILDGEITDTDKIARMLSEKNSDITPWERNKHRKAGMQ